jgi:hypothetical protein
MSALPPKADIARCRARVCYGPIGHDAQFHFEYARKLCPKPSGDHVLIVWRSVQDPDISGERIHT